MLRSSVIFRYTMLQSRRTLIRQYGKAFWKTFRSLSLRYFKEVAPQVPDIGKSIFSLNYRFVPAYVAWYRAFRDLELAPAEIDRCIWMMNDRMVANVPRWLSKAIGRSYYRSFQKKAALHLSRQEQNQLHPLDWRIAYRKLSEEAFEIDILTCPFQKLSAQFGVAGLLPGICRMDYLFANRLSNGFSRTKTLGDGDDCCNCHYEMTGNCVWAPETGFADRK
ncbi:MAG: L-2-amino-thiazoline-4-carboxylic acid hydrolase [Eubacteriales bacterium]|nr:L-2-amino-thiazoline-4-carboxylic acid hydrolase [Eubacteriales bacterium]